MSKAKSVSHLKPGQRVTLNFAGSKSLGNEAWTEDYTFLGFVQDGQRARFGSTLATSIDSCEFEAYRDRGGWAYGSSAERLTVKAVIED